MEEQVVVAVAEDTTTEGLELWRVKFERPDGSIREHIFPKMTLDARAAEYGISPEDVDTLLDVILAEPYILHPGDARNHAADPAAKAGHRVKAANTVGAVKKGQDVPAWLFNADNIEQARQAHLARVAHCRASTVRIVRPKGARAPDPLDVIRAAHTPDHKLIAEIADNVDQERRRLRTPRTGKSQT